MIEREIAMDRVQSWKNIRKVARGVAAIAVALGLFAGVADGSGLHSSTLRFPAVGKNYTQARSLILGAGFKPTPIPRGGKFDQCGISGEGILCKQFPELVNCVGMGAASGTCRMAFSAPDGRLVVVSTFGWDNPSTMTLTGIAWANKEDTQHIRNIISGKPEYGSPVATSKAVASQNPSTKQDFGSNDAYADDYKKKIMRNYLAARGEFLAQVTGLYFATGCKVINNPNFIEDARGEPLTALAQANGIIDTYVAGLTTKAADDGLKHAEQSGACDYFHKHPDIVYQLRQEELADGLAWSVAHGQ